MFQLGQDLEKERQILKEEQKIYRSRAQKCLRETNRRRRAFEERWKQEEEKEQRRREQILQQRKIKLQEATPKFQRAYLPFSQPKKIAQKKATFQLEEALEQIKGSVLTPGPCLPSRNKTNFGTTDDTSSSSASRNGSFHEKQTSAMVGWDKTIQESSRTKMDSNKLVFPKKLNEVQQLLEKQHLSSLENFHQEVEKTDDSESLFSLDSLEAGEQNGNYATQNESSLTTQCDCALYDPEKSQTRNNGLLYTAQSPSSKNMHLNNCLGYVDLQNNHNLPIHDLLAKHNVLNPDEHINNSEEESSASHRSGKKTAELSAPGKQESSVSNVFSFLQNINKRSKPSSGTASMLATGHPVFSPSKASASPDSIPGDRVQDLMQDQSFKMTPQKPTVSVQTSSQSIATSLILFPNQGCSTGSPSTADMRPKEKNISTEFLKNTSGKMAEPKEEIIKCIDDINPGSPLFQDKTNASVLCNVKQQNNKEEKKGNLAGTMSLMPDMELNSSTSAPHKPLKNNIPERKRARLFTSNKKESKYKPSHSKAVVMKGINFGTRPVPSIRDSLELTKIKKKSAENEKYNRKLRCCDQINQIIIENNEKCYEKNTNEISSAQLQYVQTTDNAPKTNLSIVAQPSNPMFIKNHQENFHISKPNVNAEESNKECLPRNMFMSTGCFSAAKAWMVSKDEASKPSVCSNNSKINEDNQLKNMAKITVRAQPSFMPKKRTGTIIQPQSATEANKTLKIPGKLLAPHPPSAPLPGSRHGENAASPGCQPLPPSRLQTTTTRRNGLNERHVLLAQAPKVSATGVPATRQKQVFDKSENERISEHRQQIVASTRWKPTHHVQNWLRTVQLNPVQSAFDPVQNMNNTYKSDKVSESTIQFLVAEKLASTTAAEDEILAAMESVQPARQPLLLNRAPYPGMSALLEEEQKIFHSLDHLNQRLQDVQEDVTRNPSASNVFTPLPQDSFNIEYKSQASNNGGNDPGVSKSFAEKKKEVYGKTFGENGMEKIQGKGSLNDTELLHNNLVR
ncbi:centrosomal protein of 126 kDa [Podargus strigoides]